MPRIPILNMFGRSPIRPLEKHMAKVHECVILLEPFFKMVLKEDWKAARDIRRQIARLENEADNIKRDLRMHLPKY